MLPLADENPLHRIPIVTIALIATCFWVFAIVQPAGNSLFGGDNADEVRKIEFTVKHAAVPCEITRQRPLSENEYRNVFERQIVNTCSSDPSGADKNPGKSLLLSILYSMFMHAGWLHLLGNLLFFWIFGNNVEDRIGRVRFLVFYLIAGVVSTVSHVFWASDSALPVTGASGAIAGVMGAYLALFPMAKIHTWLIVALVSLPSFVVLSFWFILQFFFAQDSSVAWVSHVSGFIFGVIAGLLFRRMQSFRPPDEVLRSSETRFG